MPTGGESKRNHSCIQCGKKVPDLQKMIKTKAGGWALLCARHRKEQQ